MIFNSPQKNIKKVKAILEKASKVSTAQDDRIIDQDAYYKLMEKAYKLKDKIKEHDKNLYAEILHSMAGYYFTKLNFSAAEKLWEEVYDIYILIKDKNDPMIASCLNNLGALYQSTERYELALDTYNKALEIARKTVDDNHPFVSRLKGYIQDVKSLIK